MSLPSPCISVCRMSPGLALRCGAEAEARSQGLCEGCFRTMAEIIAWGTLPDRQKAAIWLQLPERARMAGCEAPTLPAALATP